jgi:hypothetical protein
MAKRGPKAPLSDAHKAALAQGRTEGRIVREYLEALRANKPRRGRKRTPDSVSKRLAAIDAEFSTADPLNALLLTQERLDLRAELASMEHNVDVTALEAKFLTVARSYSKRNGVSYAAWRVVGVTPAVLKSAGVTR